MQRDSVLVSGSTFLLTDADGRGRDTHGGLYHRDTRHLDRYRLDVVDRSLESLAVVDVRPAERLVHCCTPLDGETEARDLRVSRRQVVTDGFYERLSVDNLTGASLGGSLRLAVGSSFDDLFEVRGYRETARRREVSVEADGSHATFRYAPPDLDRTWATTVAISAGDVVEATAGDGRADAVVEVDFDLDPRASREVTVAVEPRGVEDGFEAGPSAAFEDARAETRRREEEWADSTSGGEWATAAPDGWGPVLAESVSNLRELTVETEYGPVFAAGVPWFATPFGRDSLLAAYQALPLTTRVARGTCRYLAAHQADAVDAYRAAEPGKVLHEVRRGELAERGEVPHTPYYGTVDATALFVVLVHETWRFIGDDEFAAALWPHVERVVDWLDAHGDRDGDGFLEYPLDTVEGGLTHEAWKDSDDGVVHPDGAHPTGPLAVAEAQGYAYDAKRRAADLARRVASDPDRATELEREAATLRDAFDAAFWLPEEGCYAVALDGANEPVRTVTTNPGHCLWSGLVPPTRADALVDRLVADDVFTGWGLRTVSAAHRAYNPQSYHRGSVWPHDTSLVALGMARYGRHEAATRVAEGLVDAAVARGTDRLPELFAGFDRAETVVPLEYGTACEPQAWAAGAPLACLRAVGAVDGPALDPFGDG